MDEYLFVRFGQIVKGIHKVPYSVLRGGINSENKKDNFEILAIGVKWFDNIVYQKGINKSPGTTTSASYDLVEVSFPVAGMSFFEADGDGYKIKSRNDIDASEQTDLRNTISSSWGIEIGYDVGQFILCGVRFDFSYTLLGCVFPTSKFSEFLDTSSLVGEDKAIPQLPNLDKASTKVIKPGEIKIRDRNGSSIYFEEDGSLTLTASAILKARSENSSDINADTVSNKTHPASIKIDKDGKITLSARELSINIIDEKGTTQRTLNLGQPVVGSISSTTGEIPAKSIIIGTATDVTALTALGAATVERL